MGIDYDGGMIVGAEADELSIPDEFVEGWDSTWSDEPSLYDWAEEVGLDYMSRWYDADDSGIVYGFAIKSHWREDELDELIKEVKQKMSEFKELTGVDAELIGMQNIW